MNTKLVEIPDYTTTTPADFAAMPDEVQQGLLNVLSTAMEGGVNYWAATSRYVWRERGPKGEVTDSLRMRVDAFAVVYDAEEEPDEGEEVTRYTIDGASIVRGLARLADMQIQTGPPTSGGTWAEALRLMLAGEDWDYDADDADRIVQAALFGKLVFG